MAVSSVCHPRSANALAGLLGRWWGPACRKSRWLLGRPSASAVVKAEVISAGVFLLKLARQRGVPSGSRYWMAFHPPYRLSGR
jgi:hypothetical protein